MPLNKDAKLVKALAICAAAMVCVTRLSMAAGEIFNGLVLLFGGILWYRHRGELQLDDATKGYVRAVVIFALCVLPSALFGGNLKVGVREFLQMFAWRFVVFLPVLIFIRRRDYLINMLTAYMAVFGVDCLITLVQVIYKLGNNDRGWGMGGSQLGIASIICMMMPITLVVLLDHCFEKRIKKAAAFCFGGIWVALFCNKSRGSWVSNILLLPTAAVNYIRYSRKAPLALLAVFVISGGIMWKVPKYHARFRSITNTTTDRSNGDRIEGWKSCIHMVKDHPVIGIGLGRWREFYKPYYKLRTETQGLNHAHNNYFHLMAESGLLGLAGLLYFSGYFIFASLKQWRKDGNPYSLIVMLAFLGYVFIFGQVEYTLDLSSGVRIFWFLEASALGLYQLENQKIIKEMD